VANTNMTIDEVCQSVSETTKKKYSEYCKSENIEFTGEGYADFMNRCTAGLFYGVDR